MANKKNVWQEYDILADWFDEHRSRDLFEKKYLDMVIDRLKVGAKILDLGCGMGEPIARYFIDKGFHVTGVDGSQKQIDLAQARFPDSSFIVADMRGLNLGEKFDCIVAWDSFFHLPQSDQRKMFETFAAHLNPGGILLFTTGAQESEVWGDNGGVMLYHASLSPEEYKRLLSDHNFDLITYALEDKECQDHSVWVAQYK